MNEIANKFLLAGDKCMPEIHLKQPEFTYSTCGPFTNNQGKNSEIYRSRRYKLYLQKRLDKACFLHDIALGDFKDLVRGTASYKVLKDKACNIAKNPNYNGYQRGLASMVYKFFDKKSALHTDKSAAGSAVNIHANNKTLQRLLDLATHEIVEELHNSIIKKIKKRTVHSGFKDNIWGADLADMQLINTFNKGIRFLLLCVIRCY